MSGIKPVTDHPDYSGNLRCQRQEWTPAEQAISDAMGEVERSGGSLHLTNAIRLLSQARQAVAQHILAMETCRMDGLKRKRRVSDVARLRDLLGQARDALEPFKYESSDLVDKDNSFLCPTRFRLKQFRTAARVHAALSEELKRPADKDAA